MLSASELSDRLAHQAEAVCRHYLSSGWRTGNYWIVGDVANNKGRSLYVHLTGPRAGRWADAATSQYGDLLDLIRETCGLIDFRDVAEEVRHFLSLPPPLSEPEPSTTAKLTTGGTTAERARRLFAMTRPLAGTLGDHYLRQRGILRAVRYSALAFHPSCYYRDFATGRTLSFPALIAAVTDVTGTITGVHRTWLDPDGDGKAKVADPRRALGSLLGNAVRLNMDLHRRAEAMAAGEGLETMLSISHVMPAMPVVAALTASHLGAFGLPPALKRLYIAADADAAGRRGIEALSRRAQRLGILPLVLSPELGDFNEDLRRLGPDRMTASIRAQLVPDDAKIFLPD